ncbi:MAG: TadE/TadG family type IV pilus assembly protein [Collinsella sp.]|nr:TadE/TadG family type IV pilus assembly protein [Collinsella sp.]
MTTITLSRLNASCRGQATVETIATFILMLVMLLAALAVGFAMFQRSQVDYALANVGVWLPSELSGDDDADVKDMVVHAGLFIDPDSITVKDASIVYTVDTTVELDSHYAGIYAEGAQDAQSSVGKMRIKGTVIYSYQNILTGFAPETYTRSIDRTFSAARNFQVF